MCVYVLLDFCFRVPAIPTLSFITKIEKLGQSYKVSRVGNENAAKLSRWLSSSSRSFFHMMTSQKAPDEMDL